MFEEEIEKYQRRWADDSSADSELQAFRADQRANLKWHLKSKGVRSMSTAYNAQ